VTVAPHEVRFLATTDYFAIGTPDDFVRVPMSPLTAQRIADMLGLMLPTTLMVDLIWKSAAVKLDPEPMVPPDYPYDASMLSVARFAEHNRLVELQRKGRTGLVRGHKKDVVLTNRLEQRPDQVAIYGWLRADGQAIQPLSLVHENSYADYSHGIGFVDPKMSCDGEAINAETLLEDPDLAPALSSEGVLRVLRQPKVAPEDRAPSVPARPVDYALPLGERCVTWELAELAAGPRPDDERILFYFSGCEKDGKPQTGLTSKNNWCAASACAAAAACVVEGEEPPHGYRAGGIDLVTDAQKSGAWRAVADVRAKKWQPRKGDLAIFQRGQVGQPNAWERHVARVDLVLDAQGNYCTVGGNEGVPGEWKKTARKLTDTDLLGFIAYPPSLPVSATAAKPVTTAPEPTTAPVPSPPPQALPTPPPPPKPEPPPPPKPPVLQPSPPVVSAAAQAPLQTMPSYGASVALLFIMAASVAVGLAPRLPGGFAWVVEAALMCAFLAIVGLVTCGKTLGVLIDSQKLVSLSRFQSVMWTVIVLSAYFTMAMRRLHLDDPLAIAVDWHLWVLMGISMTSLVGTPLLQGWKKGMQPEDGSFKATAAALDQTEGEVDDTRRGILYGNPSIDDAAISDMFGGDEVGNAAHVDLGKVQMFFFTMVAALVYVVLIYTELDTKAAADLTSLPALTTAFIAVLGLSHAAHLGMTATRDTPVSADADADATASPDASVQKILAVVSRIDRTTSAGAQTSQQILDKVSQTTANGASGTKTTKPVAQA
jgi:hypothetical protein